MSSPAMAAISSSLKFATGFETRLLRIGTNIVPPVDLARAISFCQLVGFGLATTATVPPQRNQFSVGANSAAPATANSKS